MHWSAGATTTTAWNGGLCYVCHAGYVGSHTCKVDDLNRRIGELVALRDRIGYAELAADPEQGLRKPYDTSGCPCRTENGGSGVCGCILGGPQIT